jgi:hypothetical protein
VSPLGASPADVGALSEDRELAGVAPPREYVNRPVAPND